MYCDTVFGLRAVGGTVASTARRYGGTADVLRSNEGLTFYIPRLIECYYVEIEK